MTNKLGWLMVTFSVLSLGCAPQYYYVGLPLGTDVGQKGSPLGEEDLGPCKAANPEEGDACVYYVTACKTKGLHTLEIQRKGKDLQVTAYCVEPNALSTSAAVKPEVAAQPAVSVDATLVVEPAQAQTVDPGPM